MKPLWGVSLFGNRTWGEIRRLKEGIDNTNSVTPTLGVMNGDQNRVVEYQFDIMGTLHESYTDQAFDTGGNRVAYLRTGYTYDVVQGPNGPMVSHGWLQQIQNTWNWLDANQQAHQTVLSERS